MTNIVGINKNNRHKWKYPIIPSAQRPIPHSENVPIPASHQAVQQSQEDQTETPISSQVDDDFEYCESSNPKPFSQNELNDLIRDLDLSKERAELLASRLKEKNCLSSDVRVDIVRENETYCSSFHLMKILYIAVM